MRRSSSPAQSDEPSRPQGLDPAALILTVVAAIELLWALLHLRTANPIAVDQLLAPLVGVLELFTVYQFWRGQNWARILVLLWAGTITIEACSSLVEHNGDPTALMSHPLSFFRALLACFLLYWLNTPPVRAWFRKISSTTADLLSEQLIGKLCTAVESHSGDLAQLSFEHDATLTLRCPWRIVMDNNLVYAHAPVAGSEATSNAAAPDDSTRPSIQASESVTPGPNSTSDPAQARILQNLRVQSARVAPHTSDLVLTFEMGIELQTWSAAPAQASSVTQWKFSDPALTVVAANGAVPQVTPSVAAHGSENR